MLTTCQEEPLTPTNAAVQQRGPTMQCAPWMPARCNGIAGEQSGAPSIPCMLQAKPGKCIVGRNGKDVKVRS